MSFFSFYRNIVRKNISCDDGLIPIKYISQLTLFVRKEKLVFIKQKYIAIYVHFRIADFNHGPML